MNSKDKGKSKLGLLGVAAAVILVVIVAGAVFMKRYAPSKQWMSGYEYFDADKASDSALVIINGTKYQDTGVSVDGIWYLPADFIADNINIRFYEDGESNAILYTDDKKTYTYEPGKNIYTDSDNNEYNTNYPVTVAVNGSTYIAWDYVAQYTNCTYAYGEEPARICINSIDGEEKVVDAKKDIYTASISAIWTISGLSDGLPFAAYIFADAASSSASAPRPYTVSVGNATRPPALNISPAFSYIFSSSLGLHVISATIVSTVTYTSFIFILMLSISV